MNTLCARHPPVRMPPVRSLHYSLCVTISALCLLLDCAVAQAAMPPDQSAVLEQITVTAQKVAENAQQVPIAITALNADELDSRQVSGLSDIKYLVPNLYLEENLSNAGTPKIFMRGIGQANSAFSFDSPVGIYVDDVYYAKEIGSLVDFFDIDHIEVLRGPQGTIYGRNSSIGAIRVVTKSAPLEKADALGEVTFGSENQRNARIDLGAPIIEDELGFRIAFNSKHNDGFQLNTVNGDRSDSDDSDAVRAQLLAKFNDNISLTMRSDYLRDDSRPPVATNFINNSLSSLNYQSELSYSDSSARSRLETFGSSATLDWKLGDEKLTSISAWRGVNTVNAFDADGTITASFEVPQSDLKDRSLTQEVFVTGPRVAALPIDWVAGAFYLHEKTSYIYSMQIFAPASVQDYVQTVDSVAGYLQGTYHVTDKLGITAGARYTTEHKDFDVASHLADGSFDFAFSDHSLSADRTTWRGVIDYQLESSVLLYTSAATGFRSGGLNGNALSLVDVTGGAFQQEDTLMYEAGIKSEFLDHRLRLNVDYFYGDYHNLQEAVVEQNGSVSNENNNAHVNGLELETEVVPFTGMKLSATVGTLNDTIAGSTTKLPDAPHLTWNLSARYAHGVGVYGVMSGGVSWSHTGSSFEDAANTPIIEVGAHDNVDANATLTSPDEHWQFSLAGLNLTDRVYPIGGFYIAGGFIAATEWPSLPRRWAFSVRYKY
jgi:iron complex outermembrane receptor protein